LDNSSQSIELGRSRITKPVKYGISDRKFFPGIDPAEYLDRLFESSADFIQWREGGLGSSVNRAIVKRGVEFAREKSRLFIVNSDFDLAVEEEADGFHLKSNQDLPSVLDRIGGRRSGMIVGKSAHSQEEAITAEAEGADYITLSPIFEPYSKETDHGLLGLTKLRSVAQILTIPVFALGGVDYSRMGVVCAAGAAGIAGTTWINTEISPD